MTRTTFVKKTEVPALLVAYARQNTTTVDRCALSCPAIIGRSSDCTLSIRDERVSKKHMKITRDANKSFWIEDLGSTNGTFLNGLPLLEKSPLRRGSVLRVGRAVLVFQAEASSMLEPGPAKRYGIEGSFHTAALLQSLTEAALSRRHVLLAGPSGAGKELAAYALASMMGNSDTPLPILAHNAAVFSSEEEAASSLFGVAPKVFSNVDARPGLIEQAQGGLLFIDEVHNLPTRVQRSLLRVIEDSKYHRIGETKSRDADVHFVLASNAPAPTFDLAHDLLARLRVVKIPPLSDRTADVPAIFDAVLRSSLKKYDLPVDGVFRQLTTDHYEALCLEGFKDENVRGLGDIADRIATRIAAGIESRDALMSVFTEQLGENPVVQRYLEDSASLSLASNSYYEKNKELMIAALQETRGNVSKTADLLKSRGIRCSRRWLSVYADRWGLKKSDLKP